MKKRIVVLGPSFGNYVNSIANGFRENGLEVTELTYIDPPATLAQRGLWRVLPSLGIKVFPRAETARLAGTLRELCKTKDMLVVVKGDRIPMWLFEEMATFAECPIVLWYMDAVSNIDFGIRRAKLASFLLYFERTDGAIFREHHIAGVPVDLAADPRWYHPLHSVDKRYDVSFLGTFYPERLEILDQLISALAPNEMSLDVRGQYVSALRPWRVAAFRKSYPSLWKVVKHVQMAAHESINMLNNESRICLNITRKESLDSLNLRVFELCASGAFQLVEAHPALSRCLGIGHEIEVFNCAEEAADKIRFFRDHPEAREKIALAGLERIRKDHTMTIRIREIIAMLRSNGVLGH